MFYPPTPNPAQHKKISFIKSTIRIIGYIVLFMDIPTAAILLILSEALGIIEETV